MSDRTHPPAVQDQALPLMLRMKTVPQHEHFPHLRAKQAKNGDGWRFVLLSHPRHFLSRMKGRNQAFAPSLLWVRMLDGVRGREIPASLPT